MAFYEYGKNSYAFKYWRNKVQYAVKQARKTYYSHSVDKLKNTNPTRWWKEIKSVGSLSSQVSWHSQLLSETIPTCGDLAEYYNDYLVGLTSHFNPLQDRNPGINLSVPSNLLVSTSSVLAALQRIKQSKSCGPDLIPNKILKTFAFELAPVVCDIYNTSMRQGIFPQQLKRSFVVPIPKLSPPVSIEDDLRPISLTSQIAKVMEDFSLRSLMVEIRDKIDVKQFAVPGKSSTQALVYLLHMLAALDAGHCFVRLFFADFRKGFDLVDHNILIDELESLNVHPVIIRWIRSFLMNREQCVRIGRCTSSWKTASGGLPQGTKLGPILFAILVNPLLKDWQGRIKFVDDTTAVEIIPRCSPSLMPIVVNEISTFAFNRGMELNHKKCKEMVISFLKYDVARLNPIYVSGLPVQSVSSFKLLGVTLSNDLTWNSHVEKVIRKANSRLYAPRQLKKAGLSKTDLVIIYSSFVRSVVEYAAPAWSNVTMYLSDSIETIQKRSLRIIYPSLTYEDALVHSSLRTLVARREDLCKSFIHKLRSNNINVNNNPVAQLINTQSQVHEHNYELRTQPINPPFPRTDKFKNFITINYF